MKPVHSNLWVSSCAELPCAGPSACLTCGTWHYRWAPVTRARLWSCSSCPCDASQSGCEPLCEWRSTSYYQIVITHWASPLFVLLAWIQTKNIGKNHFTCCINNKIHKLQTVEVRDRASDSSTGCALALQIFHHLIVLSTMIIKSASLMLRTLLSRDERWNALFGVYSPSGCLSN